MKDKLGRIRLVVMESPYDTWNHPLTETLYARMVGLKLKGYGRVFPYGVLAADTTDLISDHLLVCEETEHGLKPLFGNKAVPIQKCEDFHLAWPGLSVVEEAHAPLHCRAMNKIILDAKYNNVDLRYAGSMTIDPDETGDKEWQLTLRELFTTLYVNFYQGLKNPEIIAGATIRFKVQNFSRWMGHHDLELNGEVLGPIRVTHLNNEEVMWTHLKQFSFEARQTAKKWESMWNNRIHIAADKNAGQNKTVKKAA